MIKVMIIEDEEHIRKILSKMVEKVDGFEVVAQADSFASAVQEFSVKRPEVVFVDVDLNGDSGLECAKVMTNIDSKLKVIFATAHSEYMANAFEIYAFDYLVKPFDMERVHKTLHRIQETMDIQEVQHAIDGDRDRLLIKGKEQMIFVDKKDIVMIERVDHATNILTMEQTYRTSTSLADLEEKLNHNFMRSHKSYIINLEKISSVEPYGRWTHIVKFNGIQDTALITSQKYDELKEKFE
ncbi:MAG: LytTR family DNA-binding domain-containing protein [Eubacteriales bacterium]|nr:LytTR family DNA-binding domain-containing protein [Eubacteriales bacterium]